MKALISVSDKTGVCDFARGLLGLGFELVSTGGTYKILCKEGLKVQEISSVSGVGELFEGRVKTLHPKIAGGILYKRKNASHIKQAKDAGIEAIDLVCVNLYPFKKTVQKTEDFEEIIENIDIGGPTLLRAAAKNYKDVLVVCDSLDYTEVLEAIASKKDDEKYRLGLMIKAYEHTANYDSFIANYLNERFNFGFGKYKFIVGKREFKTKYGENPHQRGALYSHEDFFKQNFTCLKGEASFNNLSDINAALNLACAFGDHPSVAIIKHANACGFALKDNLEDSYKAALKCDSVSAYGGVIAINGTLNKDLATMLNEIYFELIIAANVDAAALEVFKNKKRIKIFSQENEFLTQSTEKYDFRKINGGFLYQDSDFFDTDEVSNARLVSEKAATPSQIKDLEIAYKIAAFTKSNNIIYVKDSAMVATGMGMTSRVAAVKVAISKAKDMDLDLNGCVMASEAFLPFRDSLDEASKIGVKALIQPGGSIRDDELIKAANEYGIAMYFTGKRHFLH